LETEKIRAEPLITHRRPLSQALQVLQMMEERQPDLIKAVLVP
jgi:threonine dehydrogenase-like Zn-dependent dehydrogenase